MTQTRPLRSLAFAALVLAASAALAAEFKSERGFSLTYPDGWRALSKELLQKDLADQAKAMVPKGPEVNLDKVTVSIYNAAPTSLGENINVVVIAGRLPMTDASCAKYRQGMLDQYAQRGAKVSNADCRLAKAAGRDAISWHCDVQPLGPYPPIRQWQLVLSSRRQSYIVTCTAPASAYAAAEPIFTQIVDSIRIEPDKGFSLDDYSPLARSAIIGAAIGALVGGIIAIVRIARRKPRPTA